MKRERQTDAIACDDPRRPVANGQGDAGVALTGAGGSPRSQSGTGQSVPSDSRSQLHLDAVTVGSRQPRRVPELPEGTRVLVVHDYLTQRGGAERVVLSLLRTFPGAPLLTTLYNPASTYPEFADHDVRTLWVDRLALLRKDPRRALPLLAHAISSATVTDVDVLVCSSSGWAHGVPSAVPKLVYCHTPARWLWETQDYLPGLPGVARPLLAAYLPWLRRWDLRAADSCAAYLANSTTVRDRIRRIYGRDAAVVHPPVSIDTDAWQQEVPGLRPGYLLTVSRSRSYKNTNLVCEAVEREPDLRLVVVGDLPPRQGGGTWSDRLRALSNVSDAQMRWLYQNASALVAVSREDFGLTPIEAYAFGVPAVLLRAGGYLDSSVEWVTCVFVDELSVDGLLAALQQLRDSSFDSDRIRAHSEQFREAAFQQRIRQAVAEVLLERRSEAGLSVRQAFPPQQIGPGEESREHSSGSGPVLDLVSLEQRHAPTSPEDLRVVD